MTYDCIVVGAGPAGATLAYELAKKGFKKVLAIDKERFPRYKPCGGCLSLKVKQVLDLDISDIVDTTVYGITFGFRGRRPLDIVSDRPLGYNIKREVFDNLLLERAKKSGVEVLQGRGVEVVNDTGDGVTVVCSTGESFTARVVGCADGAGSRTARTLFGMDSKKCAAAICAELPYDAASMDGKLLVDFGSVPYGYAWAFPKKGFLSIGIAVELKKIRLNLNEHLDFFISRHRLLKGLEVKKRFGWSIPVFYSDRVSLAKGRVFLVGDAGHLVDPFIGEGIYYAIRSAQIAASVVVESLSGSARIDLAPYDERLRKELYGDFSALRSLSKLVYGHPRVWYRLLEKEPQLMLRYYDVVRGEEGAKAFYDWVLDRLKERPFMVIRRWIESRFI